VETGLNNAARLTLAYVIRLHDLSIYTSFDIARRYAAVLSKMQTALVLAYTLHLIVFDINTNLINTSNLLTNKVARLSLFRSVHSLCIIYGHTWVNYDEFCSDRQIPILCRIELSKSFLPSPSSLRTVVYITSYLLFGSALSINLDPTHSIFLRLQKLQNFQIS